MSHMNVTVLQIYMKKVVGVGGKTKISKFGKQSFDWIQ